MKGYNNNGGCNSCLNFLDSNTIFHTGNGSSCDPLILNVLLSQASGNTLHILSDGIFASGGTYGGNGTVTSVGLQADEIFYHVANSPITTDGIIQLELYAASGNTVWGNPTNSSNLGNPRYYQPNASILNTWFGGTIQPSIELSTSGSTGAATLIGNVLNIPQYSGGAAVQEGFYGTIYDESTWTNTNDFTNLGATVSVVGGFLQFTGGTGAYTQTLELVNPTMLENWRMTAFVSYDQISSTTYGFGLGIDSINSYNKDSVVGRLTYAPGTVTGMFLDTQSAGGTYTTQVSSNAVPTINAGDIIFISVERDGATMTMSIRNVTTNSDEVTVTFDYAFMTGPGYVNTGRFSIYSFGGQFTVRSFTVSSLELKFAPVMFIGDSKTQGYYASSISNRFPTLLESNYKVAVHAGSGDRTTEVLASIQEIINLKPIQAVLCIGSNDPRSGISEEEFEANYTSISNQLLAAGIDVIYSLPFYETAEDLTAQKTFIQATFPANKILDGWTPMTLPGSLYTDGAHPNDLGHSRIQNSFLYSFILNYRNYRRTTSQ